LPAASGSVGVGAEGCAVGRTCKEVDVMLTGLNRCYMSINTNLLHTSYFVLRHQFDTEQENQ
jgi:hypothetical protein